MKKMIFEIFVCMLLIAAAVPTVGAANWTQVQKLLPSDSQGAYYFGYSVSVDGDTALIGSFQGAAYVFIRTGTTWTQQAKLNDSDEIYGSMFACSVSLDGDTALIGAYNAEYKGAAYVFTRSGTTWTQQAKLTASDSGEQDEFGVSVSLDGDTALIGARYKVDVNNVHSGAAYVFTRTGTTWTQQAKLTTSDGATDSNFGISVSLSGGTALVGANSDDDNGYMSGSAYVFTRSGTTWTPQLKLHPSDGASEDYFGLSVSLSGDTALIGKNGGYSYNKAAYVFARTGATWTQQAKLLSSNTTVGGFGCSVSLSGNTALIGAEDDDNGDNTNRASSGSAYVFTRSGTTWTQQQKLTNSDSAREDHFGSAVSLSGNTALIGAIKGVFTKVTPACVYVFTTAGENKPPVASFTWTPLNPEPNQTIVFDASASYDTDGSLTAYEWDWNNDGVYEESHTTPSASHVWTQVGDYPVTVRVADTGSVTDTATITVAIGGENQPPDIPNTTPSPKTPGFELVFVIGAIALSMLLLRKKRIV